MKPPSHPLVRHPYAPARAASVAAGAVRSASGGLSLHYRIERAGAGSLVLPPPAAPSRTDGLWKMTCLEAFIRAPGSAGYLELNMSPSTAWAAYSFDDYRSGMTPAEAIAAPRIDVTHDAAGLTLTAAWELSPLTLPDPRAAWRLGLSAVIEDEAGLSYWALTHPPGQVDFHHADGFVLELAAAI